jgi:hypothetical protein
MPLASQHQQVEIRAREVEGSLGLELADELRRTRPMVAVPTFVAALGIVQQGEQPRHQRRYAKVAGEPAPMERDPRPMACPVNALPIEPKSLPHPPD